MPEANAPNAAPWVLYGAYGYTGRLILAEALRLGLRPTLAGRNADKLAALAKAHNLRHQALDLHNPAALRQLLQGQQAVLHAAGPYVETAQPMVDAALAEGCHYLDLTGELPTLQAHFAKQQAAQAAGVALLPSVGFDVVPSDSLLQWVANQVGGRPQRLFLAFRTPGGMSGGTAQSTVEAIRRGGSYVRQAGQLVRQPLGTGARRLPLGPGEATWVAPIAWGDLETAHHATGCPNIVCASAIGAAQKQLLPTVGPLLEGLFQWAPARQLARRAAKAWVDGPNAQALDQHHAWLYAEATGPEGQTFAGAMRTPEPYRLTAWTAVGALQAVLAGTIAPGVHTPAQALGTDWVLRFPGVLRWQGPATPAAAQQAAAGQPG